MIVPMKKVTVLALASDETWVLARLREIGVMHIAAALEHSRENDAADFTARLNDARRVVNILSGLTPAPGDHAADGATVMEEVLELLNERQSRTRELQLLQRRLSALAPWGDFDGAELVKLRKHGLGAWLLTARNAAWDDFAFPEGVSPLVLSRDKAQVRALVVATVPFDGATLPGQPLPDSENPAELHTLIAHQRKHLHGIETRLASMAAHLELARHYLLELENEEIYFRARHSVAGHGAIMSLCGFVPEPELVKLREGARKHGWGLLINDPDEGDRVPTLVQMPQWARLVKPLFDFLGIAPGYHELDASGAILVFFTIFYAMIVGDAGYGLLFLLLSVAGSIALREKPAARMPLRFLGLLSVATILWGAATGNWFGIEAPGIPWLTTAAGKDSNIQAICFMLAGTQLTLGRLWQAALSGKLRPALGNFGWALMIWGNFFMIMELLVWPDYFPKLLMLSFYCVGLTLIVTCGVNWLSIAGVFQFPFDIIGSFSDVLSYIRLFAVGMAGFYIASSFNGMGYQVMGLLHGALIPVGILIILAGHALNLGLCMMSVLVHGVRLNTLEFSNHSGLQWGGFAFKPFKKLDS